MTEKGRTTDVLLDEALSRCPSFRRPLPQTSDGPFQPSQYGQLPLEKARCPGPL